ncbi:MAG: tRNA (adenosine(37)-N6)-threonylcarbamoyltransferase complex ATPase subunit type 1 TsaE, partial [bacterium]|nr:tRNA (adenosine(37)-N6)-threonylcarbamoyltransferase complex ATPase subunit type 1 TsaE [bacterium]
GAGKTHFVKAIGKILEIKKINSPTFVIMKKYKIPGVGHPEFRCPTPGIKHLYHLDAYRLKNEKELLCLGWKEIISKPANIIFIEWPENVIKAMPKKHIKIKIKHTKDSGREFKIS